MMDVAIIGAGVAGCIAAIALAPTHKVVLIDKQPQVPERVGDCLPAAAKRILQRLELFDGFEKQSHLVSRGMASFWGSNQPQVVDAIRNPDGFGWHLDRREFGSFLRQSARHRNVTCLWPAKLVATEFSNDRWHLVTDDLGDVDAKFVIDAGGRGAPFARKQGVKRDHVDKLISCWATIPVTSTSKMGFITAAETGWWYSAPLPGKKRVLAFQTDPDLLDANIRRDGDLFLDYASGCPELAKNMGGFDDWDDSGQVHYQGVIAANSSRLTRGAGDNWAALGDAAFSFDPLSSQGMFNAMATAMQLTDILKNSAEPGSVYKQQIERIWQHYLNHRRVYYRLEKRWQNSPFWKRRIVS